MYVPDERNLSTASDNSVGFSYLYQQFQRAYYFQGIHFLQITSHLILSQAFFIKGLKQNLLVASIALSKSAFSPKINDGVTPTILDT